MNIKNMLIADDNEENRRAAREVFPQANIVSSGKEAIEIIESGTPFDLVLTDIIMEKPYSGFEVVRTAMQYGNLVYTLSNSGKDHGMDYVDLNPYGFDNFSELRMKFDIKTGKQNPKTWELALEDIMSNPAGKPYKHSISNLNGGESNWILDKHTAVAIYGYHTCTNMTAEQRIQLKNWLEDSN